MRREGGWTISPHRWPVVALKPAALDWHPTDGPAVPTRLQDAAERVRAPVHALATGRAPHGKPVTSPILLPAQRRVAVKTVARDRVARGTIRGDTEAQAVVTIEPAVGGPAS